MKQLKSGLLTTKYTKVLHEEEFNYNAPHRFQVVDASKVSDDLQLASADYKLADIHFQEGPIKECGVNGVANEDLIGMVICRLEHFQKSQFACRENALAITKLEESLMWLRKRTMDRESRNVEGTNVV